MHKEGAAKYHPRLILVLDGHGKTGRRVLQWLETTDWPTRIGSRYENRNFRKSNLKR